MDRVIARAKPEAISNLNGIASLVNFLNHLAMTVDNWFCPSVYAASKGADPVAHWRFDEAGGGTAYDESANNNDGTLNAGAGGTNTAVGQMWTRQGKIGAALECDGTDDYVNCGTPTARSGSLTISAWIKTTQNPGATQRWIITRSIWTTGAWQLMTYDGKGAVEFGPGGQLAGSAAIADGNWHHIVGIYDSSNNYRYIYIDGKLDATDTTKGAFNENANSIYLGVRPDASSYFSGLIDDVRIYNYARTADQIMVDYNAGSAVYLGAGTDPNEGNPPIGYWTLDENTGTTVYDRSGNGNNGTITGASWTHGKYGTALNFNGSSDYVSSASNTGISGNATFTLEAWFKTDTLSAAKTIVFTGDSGTALAAASLGINVAPGAAGTFTVGEGAISLEFAGANGARTATGLITTDTWYHFAAVKTAGAINTTTKIYLNGAEQTLSTSSINTPNITNGIANIGRFSTAGYYFDGLIDDVKIYNYARTQAQIAYDYNKGKPVAHYKFDEGGGPIAHNEYSLPSIAPHRYWRFIQTGILVSHAPRTCELKWTDLLGNARTPDSVTHGGTFSYSEDLWNTSFDGQTNTSDAGWITGDTGYITADFGATGCVMMKFEAYGSYTGSARGATWDIQYSDDNSTWLTVKTWNFQTSDNGGGLGAGNYAGWYGTTWHTHGTLVGDTKFVDGKIGKALQFDGSGDYMIIEAPDYIFNSGDFSVSLWAKPSVMSSYTGLITTDTTGDSAWKIIRDSGDPAHFKARYNSTLLNYPDVSAGDWHHYGYVKSGTTLSLYLDGKFTTSSACPATHSVSGTKVVLGSYRVNDAYSNSWMYNGLIDDVRIYNYSRTAEQIMIDYNAGATTRLGAQSAGVADPWGGALPVGHWKLDENTGVLAQDASGNGNNGTLGAGTAANMPSWIQGKNGPALSFDGTDDYVSVADNEIWNFGSNNFSIGLWVKFNSVTSYKSLMGQSNGGGIQDKWALIYNYPSSNILSFDVAVTGGSETQISVPWTPSTSQWYYIEIVRNGNSWYFYINGTQQGSTQTWSGTIPNSTSTLKIGADGELWKYHDGLIDDVRIYNYARTQAQIAWDYNQGKPAGHWRFDEGSGATAYDESDNNNDGNIRPGTTWSASGKFGKALDIAGTGEGNVADDNAVVKITDSNSIDVDLSKSFSLSVWVKPDTYVCTAILRKDGQFELYRCQGENSGITIRTWTPSLTDNTGATAIFNGSWSHLAVTYDISTTTLKLYVNGKQDGSWSISGTPVSTTSDLGIGAYPTGAYSFDGLIDDVRIYNYTRTAEQILQDYNAGAAARLGD